jgi:hypothetical protein
MLDQINNDTPLRPLPEYGFDERPAHTSSPGSNQRFLLLTTSLLVDRVFQQTNLVPELKKAGEVAIWASSEDNDHYSNAWSETGVAVESFPPVGAFREIPHNFLRRVNEYAWDFRYCPPSRLSMMRHVRNKNQHAVIKALRIPGRLAAFLRAEQQLEKRLERLLLNYPRSPEAERRLRDLKPSIMLVTGPFQFEQPGVFAAARKLGIPTLAYIPSWDNISNKARMVFDYDGYIVWSDQEKKELYETYPLSRKRPVYVCGAPQYDIFFQTRFHQSREEFCAGQGLDPKFPLIVYAIGSPNFLKEHYGAIDLAKQVEQGALGNDNAEMQELFKVYSRVKLQSSPNAGKELTQRSQDATQLMEWVNTFRHADVVVNLSSTVTIDAAIFDKPVVNLDFDPQPGKHDQQLIKDVNHSWTHFKPIAESGGIWLVNDINEMIEAIRTYLKDPSLHRAKRRSIAEYVCGYLDGRSGERMANSIIDFARQMEPGHRKLSDVNTTVSDVDLSRVASA